VRPFNPAFILTALIDVLPFLPVTICMVFGSVFLGSLLGFILAKAKVRRHRIPKLLADFYIAALRCTPPIVLLFLVFYGLPMLAQSILGVDINSSSKSIFVIVTFTLLFAATMAEVMRTAYEAVDKGQREAAVSIGMSEFQAFSRITLPQAVIVALPNFGNALINLLKDGSLAYTIGLIDIMGKGTLIINKNYGSYAIETYIALAILYWGITILIENAFRLLEKNLSKGKKSIAA
jgi:L-cystine transport system permease protein